MKAYLVEEYSPEIGFDRGSFIVALTPVVCYRLDKEGIKYSIIEDYYNGVELSAQVGDHRQSVDQWIDEFDEFLQSNIKGLELKLATIYKWYLKGMIIDPLYIQCYTLRRLFEAIKPSAVTFISSKPKELHLNYRLEHPSESLYAQIIPILCRERSIPLVSIFLETDSKEVIQYKSLTTRFKSILSKGGIARRVYFACRYSKKQPFAKPAKQGRLNIFMLKTAHIGDDFIIDALARSHSVYLLSDNHITKYSHLGAGRYLDLKIELNEAAVWERTASLLESNDLIKRFDEKCQLDISEVASPRLRYFISIVCPEIERYVKVFTRFYEKDRIDILFTPYISSLMEYAALAAANHYEHTKTACLVHGDAVYDSRTWNTGELQSFDIHISSHAEAMEYFRRLSNELNSSTKLYNSPHRLLSAKRINYLREKKRGNIRKNRIIYLTTFMAGDIRRRMDGTQYGDTWYYKFQKSLIEYFSTRREFTFVWKGLPATDALYNPIPNFVKDNNFTNIEIATNSFYLHLLSADRVICDLPSTGFYESVVAGIPTLSLYHKALIVRKSAVDYFGNLLKLYSDIPEAIKHIDDFLSSDPELYKTTINTEGWNILDILEEVGKEEKQ